MNVIEIQDVAEKKFLDYLYYIMIAIVSLCAMLIIPCFGSSIGMEWSFPNTASGWVVFVTTKLTVALVNILIFHGFVKQSRINIRDNPSYLEAVTILQGLGGKTYIPRSVSQLNKKEYSSKMTTIFITSLLSAFSFSQAIMTFDMSALISYATTVLFGVIFGILEMKKYEDYYTNEYLDYARYIQRLSEKETNDANYRQEEVCDTREHSIDSCGCSESTL